MPKVRASSATIGTTRLPMASSFMSWASSCTKAMVVDWLRSLELNAGTASFCAATLRTRQVAAEPLAARMQVFSSPGCPRPG